MVDPIKAKGDKLRKEQTAYRKGCGTAEPLFILRNIIEQANEWQSSLYVNFVDFRKAFDSIERTKLWNILKSYGIPPDIIDLLREIYRGNKSCIVQNGNVSEWFQVETGVRQGCVMSGFLFIVAVDWIMKNATNRQKNGIRWRLTSTLDDLDYAGDIALLSSTHSQLQNKTTRVNDLAKYVGLHINTSKTQVMKLNSKNNNPLIIEGNTIEEVEEFTYLGSKISKTGGAEKDIKHRLSLARNAFSMLQPVWKSSNFSKWTKLRIFQSNVMSVLFYGAEMWRMTEVDSNKIDVFHRTCLKRILKIHWPRVVSNKELYEMTDTSPASETIKFRPTS